MKIIQKDKTYEKADKSTKRIINHGIRKLDFRLSTYFAQNIKIENIYNDDVLIHDIINKNFYVYKCQVDGMQLRILYTIDKNELVIVSHYCKKKPTKEYISYFEKISSVYKLKFEK